jgi:hypothetical protein
MNNVIFELVPMIIGAAVVPVWIIIVLLLLRGEGGLLKASAFVGGQILVRLAQGFVFGYVLAASHDAQTEQGAHAIVSTLILVVGILLWITAVKKWLNEPDADEPPPKWMTMFNSVSAGKAFVLSLALMLIAAKQWIFTLGALSIIREADLPRPDNAIAFLVFVLGAQFLVLIPILFSAVAPNQSKHFLEASSQWLERNNRMVVIVVSVIFGAYFIFKGITGLLG